jgi:hypothetical protein
LPSRSTCGAWGIVGVGICLSRLRETSPRALDPDTSADAARFRYEWGTGPSRETLFDVAFFATGHFSTRLNFHDHAFVRAQLDTAVYGLVLAVCGGG